MTAWIVLGCVALVLALLLWIPLTGRAEYTQDGFGAAVSVGPVTIPLYPRAKKRPKRGKKPRRRAAAPKPDTQADDTKPVLSLGSWKQFQKYLPLVCEAAGELRRKIVVRKLNIHLVWAGKDPASAAIGYGMIHGVIGGLWNLVEHSFRVKDHKFVVDLDYEKREPQVQLQALLTLRVGQIIHFGIRYGMKFLAIHRRDRKNMENSKEVNSHE